MPFPSPAHWQSELDRLWRPPVVVLGVGRRGHGDDAAGPLLIDRLPRGSGLIGIDCGPTPENFLGPAARHKPGLVLLVDAVSAGAPPGTVRLLRPDQLAQTDLGTHGLSPGLLLRALRETTAAPVLLLGIEAERVGPDLPPSQAVLSAVEAVAAFLKRRLAE